MKSLVALTLLAGAATFCCSANAQANPQQQPPAAEPQQNVAQPVQQQPAPTPPAEQQPAQQQPAQPQAAPQQPAPFIARTNLKQKFNGPTLSEIYCSGFFTKNELKETGNVVGGALSPDQATYAEPEYIYIKGKEVKEGDEYSILRHYQDPNRYESFKDQLKTLKSLGEEYQDVARAKVMYMRGKIGIAKIESSCDGTVPGDIAVPFQERPRPEFRRTKFEEFPPENEKEAGRIVTAKDLDTILGVRRIVYLNIGERQNVKPGDYFRIIRDYKSIAADPVASQPFLSPVGDDTQKNPAQYDLSKNASEMPHQGVGELMVIGTTPDSSTALVTFAKWDVRLGDAIEPEEAVAEAPVIAPTSESAVPQPPTIGCSVSRNSMQVGESASISCNATAEEGHEVSVNFRASAGQITPQRTRATLTSNAPGPITVTATAVDDRNLSAQTNVNVDVQAAPTTPTPAMLNELMFKQNGTYVDNRAKAALDDDALRLQRELNSTLTLEGSVNPSENEAIALERANNAKAYLTKSKGIDASRIQTKAAESKTGAKVQVILVPAGIPQQ
jgi:outer membrane protein OmpA-like peptidoglycan-associated protein